MKLFLALLALTSTASAAPTPPKTYELDMKLSLDGKTIASPRATLVDGQSLTLKERSEAGETFIEATVQGGKQGVLIKFTLGGVDAQGKRVVYARPQVIAAENQAATITLRENEGGSPADLSLTVTARRAER